MMLSFTMENLSRVKCPPHILAQLFTQVNILKIVFDWHTAEKQQGNISQINKALKTLLI